MKWPHRIRVTYAREFDPPEYDAHGNEILDEVDQLVPGQVSPLSAGNVDLGTSGAVTIVPEARYRIILAPVLDLPLQGTTVRYEWQDQQLVPEGAPERHMLGGRLHHYEAVSSRLT